MIFRLVAVAVLALTAGACGSPPEAAKPEVPGVPTGIELTPTGTMTVAARGAVLDRMRVTGAITVAAPDVVIRRSVFEGDGSEPWAIRTEGEGSVTIEQVTIRGGYTDAGIAGNNWTARAVEIVGASSDGAKLGDHVRVTRSWFHDFQPVAGGHIDGLQADEAYGDIVIEDNRIDVGTGEGSNAAIMLSPDVAPERQQVGPVIVRRNVLGGGGYTLYNIEGNAGKALVDVTIADNEFRPGAQYGPVYPRGVRPKTYEGNRFTDGTPVLWPM